MATYALCEALALFGLILRLRASPTQASVPYYLGGFVLLLFFRPKPPPAAPDFHRPHLVSEQAIEWIACPSMSRRRIGRDARRAGALGSPHARRNEG